MTTHESPPSPVPGRFSRSELWVVAVIGIVSVAIIFLVRAPAEPDLEMIDHALFTMTVDEMRDGAGYYEATEDAFAIVYGPERAELTETVRGFRPPTLFLIWRLLPNDRAIWLAYVLVATLAGVLSAGLARFPPLGILVSIYLLGLGMLNTGGGWMAQFTTTELWAVPVMLGAILAVRRERWWLAASLGLLAVMVRETAAPLLVVGAALALVGRLPKRPWLTSLATAAGLYGLHAILASEFIDPGVATALPSRAEIPGSLLRIVGMGLPAGLVVGLILWVLAIIRVFRREQHPLLTSAYLWLPLIGLVLERHYWGIMVVPFTLIWGIEEGADVVARLIRRKQARSISAPAT